MADGQQGGGVFNIGSQQAGTINNVAGDLVVGEQRGEATFTSIDPRVELGRLRAELARADLQPEARRQVDAALHDVETELASPQPDRGRVAGRLVGLVGVLHGASAVAAAGAALVEPLVRLAGWLGPAGDTLLDLLV